MAQTRLKSGNLHMVGGDNGSDGNVLKSKGDGTMEWGVTVVNPTFSSFDYPGDDTALDPAGGQSLVINGSGFSAGVTVTIGGTTSSSITLNSATQLTVTTPAKSAGSQTLAVINTDGGSASTNVSYNGIPAFTNAAGSLASVKSGATISVSAVATEPDGGAITYAITSGSLPSGVTLNTSTGAITGTAPSVSADTTSNFTVTATDNENQSTARAYSITVTPILPSDSFSVVTYTGNGSTQSITGVGFKPDWIWIKERTSTSNNVTFDSTRGIYEQLYITTDAESNNTATVSSFDTDGFSVGGGLAVNENGQDYVARCWKSNGGTTSSNTDGTITSTVQANQNAGFSIVTYTGNNSASQTYGHGLNAEPKLIITKRRSGGNGQNWCVWHTGLTSENYFLYLNTTAAEGDGIGTAFNSGISSSLVGIGNSGLVNDPHPYISYCFADVAGFSKFGSYTGNGDANGPIVETGFEPAFLMVKGSSNSGGWIIFDNKRTTTNPRNIFLYADSNTSDTTNANIKVDFLSNGFQLTGNDTDFNGSGRTYTYMAFAADPDTTAPTLADSFNAKLYTGNGQDGRSITGLGFSPSLVWTKERSSTSGHVLFDVVRGAGNQIITNLTDAETSSTNRLQSFDSDGFTIGASGAQNANGDTYVSWAWKADDNEPTILHETSDAVAVYKFEDNGDDVTGNYNGTETDITYTTGKFNKAASFNGTSSRILNTSFNAITGNAARSYNAWAYTDGSTAGALVCTGQWGVGGRSIALYIDQSINRFKAYGYSASYDADLGTLPTLSNGWHMFTLSWDGSSVFKAYIDGELVSTTIKNATYNTTSYLCIGDWYDATLGVYHYENLIDQVRVYAGVLTPDSITNLYNETLSQNSTLDIGTKLDGVKQSIVSANTNAGFSIVKFEKQFSSSVAENIPHGLSAAPEMIILKRTDGVEDWYVYHTSLGNAARVQLNLSTANTTGTNVWGQTNPTSSVFTVESFNAGEAIAYCFHSVSGFSKLGSYTGNGSTQSITGLGFQPSFIMIKGITSADNWFIFDSARGDSVTLNANLTAAESADTGVTSFDSDGFTLGSGAGENRNGDTYVYMAIKIN